MRIVALANRRPPRTRSSAGALPRELGEAPGHRRREAGRAARGPAAAPAARGPGRLAVGERTEVVLADAVGDRHSPVRDVVGEGVGPRRGRAPDVGDSPARGWQSLEGVGGSVPVGVGAEASRFAVAQHEVGDERLGPAREHAIRDPRRVAGRVVVVLDLNRRARLWRHRPHERHDQGREQHDPGPAARSGISEKRGAGHRRVAFRIADETRENPKSRRGWVLGQRPGWLAVGY